MIRTFIAIEIPDKTKEKIARFQKLHTAKNLPVRWININNIHITLKFIGEISESLVERIRKEIFEQPVKHESFELSIQGTGVFPNSVKPRILWAGIESGAKQISEIAADIDCKLNDLGIPKETRSFKPHITIGRFRARNKPENLDMLIAPGALESGAFTVEKVALMQSVLKPSGAEYSKLSEFSLNG